MRNREEVIKEKQQFLENEMENNKDFEKKISIAERTAAKMRIEWQDAETQRDQFQSEVCLCHFFIEGIFYLYLNLWKKNHKDILN